ncbi:acylphosphatase [Corynebacterium terpenotabidum]|uniref:acylphosphatase n=1 Tax=Corynebacterium terpenotabidum Y-11 TaxID=1200352 RepID=S4XEP8_9CORY|nr:acylphosphatase [Corynebacterium terpenotabidum]AGP31039.1 acylphosphatase [Corynebacterium terpenotabidum Y-11]
MTDADATASPDLAASPVRLTAWVHGHVQGVGFRWATRTKALEVGLVGFASNYPDGRVLVIAEGREDATDALLAWLKSGATPGRVDTVVSDVTGPRGGYSGFDTR